MLNTPELPPPAPPGLIKRRWLWAQCTDRGPAEGDVVAQTWLTKASPKSRESDLLGSSPSWEIRCVGSPLGTSVYQLKAPEIDTVYGSCSNAPQLLKRVLSLRERMGEATGPDKLVQCKQRQWCQGCQRLPLGSEWARLLQSAVEPPYLRPGPTPSQPGSLKGRGLIPFPSVLSSWVTDTKSHRGG